MEFSVATEYEAPSSKLDALRNRKEALSYFSAEAHEAVEFTIAAPGSRILTKDFVGNRFVREGDELRLNSGTSFSAPITVGVLALLTQYIEADKNRDKSLKRTSFTAREMLDLLHGGARKWHRGDFQDLDSSLFGQGIIDIEAAWKLWSSIKEIYISSLKERLALEKLEAKIKRAEKKERAAKKKAKKEQKKLKAQKRVEKRKRFSNNSREFDTVYPYDGNNQNIYDPTYNGYGSQMSYGGQYTPYDYTPTYGNQKSQFGLVYPSHIQQQSQFGFQF